MNQDALRDFVERVARGEVRHPVPEARRILGIPVVTDTRHQCRICGTILNVVDIVEDDWRHGPLCMRCLTAAPLEAIHDARRANYLLATTANDTTTEGGE